MPTTDRAPPPASLAVPDTVIAGLARLGVATVHEATGRSEGLMDPGIRPLQQGRAVAGRALTVATPEGDNWALHVALTRMRPGDLLVVAAEGPLPFGYFGDILAAATAARGGVALVIDGGVRDTAQLRAMGFAVWSRHIAAGGTVKRQPGDVDQPIRCGGAIVRPGDIVVADDDGVVVVPSGEAAAVLDAAERRAQAESRMREAVAAGATTLELLGLEPRTRH